MNTRRKGIEAHARVINHQEKKLERILENEPQVHHRLQFYLDRGYKEIKSKSCEKYLYLVKDTYDIVIYERTHNLGTHFPIHELIKKN